MLRKRDVPAPMLRFVEHYNRTFGWHLFPARMDRDKDGRFMKKSWLAKARAPGGLNWGMTADPDLLARNFSNPKYRGIGLPTGEINGLFVVEADTKQGHATDGIASLKALETRYGKFPKTLMACSPSGSLHFYFKHPGVKVWSSASYLAPGVDVRGDGGMVIAPPSIREDGEYKWYGDDVDISDAPQWLIEMVTQQPSGNPRKNIDVDDPYHQLAQEFPLPIDVEVELDDMQYPVNVHDTEVRISASLLNQGMAVDEVVELIVGEVFARIPDAKKWNRNEEIRNVRQCCSSFLCKHPELLEMQETIPAWLKTKLNGHGAVIEAVIVEDKPIPQTPWPIMGKDALYGLAGEVVKLFEGRTEADSNAILMQFLTYYGNMVGRGHYYQVESDKHYANLFCVIVGDTSKARKGVSAGRTRDLMRAVDEINNGEWFEKCIKGGLSTGEGMIHDIRDDAVVIDKDGNEVLGVARDKRRLFDEREFSRMLTVMKREANTLSHVIRDAWDSRTISVLTKTNPIRCRNPHISIAAHITSDELRRDLDAVSMANGYANRFLFACATRPMKIALGSVIDPVEINAVAAKISTQFFKVYGIEKSMMLDKQAREMWIKAYEHLSEPQQGLVGSITARSEAQVMRLALVYALLDAANEIRLPHLKAALAVWKYCEDSSRYIFGQSLGDSITDQTLEYLRDAGSAGLSRTELSGLFGRNVSASKLTGALLHLKRYGYAINTKKVAKGRPTETWYCT